MRSKFHFKSLPWELAAGLSGLILLSLLTFATFNLSAVPLLAAEPTPRALPATHFPQFDLPASSTIPHASSRDTLLASMMSQPLPELSANPVSDTTTYKGKTYHYLKTLTFRVTAYAPDPRCCYPYDGTTTASGLPVNTNGGHLVAADTSLLPMYSLVLVPGYAQNAAVPVLDRGSAIKGNRLDILLPTYEQAQKWGVKNVQVKIYQPYK